MPPTSHLLFQSEGDISVFVDTEMTPDIELRYVAKQLNRTILDFRKELGLVLSDSIKVYYSTDSDLLRSVLSTPNYLKNLSLEPYTGQESFAQTTFNYFDLSAHLYFARM
jgi:isoleucyl-tRNA synthetase